MHRETFLRDADRVLHLGDRGNDQDITVEAPHPVMVLATTAPRPTETLCELDAWAMQVLHPGDIQLQGKYRPLRADHGITVVSPAEHALCGTCVEQSRRRYIDRARDDAARSWELLTR